MKIFRRTVLLILPLFLLASCKNVNKLVEQGRYNEAIEYAVKKLAGEENKKVEYVKALEKSFNRLNAGQMKEIQSLANRAGREDWSDIIYLSDQILERQALVAPLTPLVAENNYQAKLNFVDANYWYQHAVDQFLELSWQDYEKFILKAREGDKYAARKAYYILEEIDFYEDRSLLQEKLAEAKQLATTYILMKVVKHEDARLNPADVLFVKQYFNAEPERKIWSEIHMQTQSGINYDYLSEVAIQDIIVSPGVDDRTIERVSRDIQTGEKAMRDEKGRVVVDSSGDVIMTPIFETVRGEIIRIRQFKDAKIQAEIRIVKKGELRPVTSSKKTSGAEFTNAFQDWRGDKRAFDNAPRRGHPAPYPPDEALIQEAVGILQEYARSYTVDWMSRLP
jgi:hypothetical protein